ncbi:MAG: Bax inhibitor-1 family protein [Acidobacteriaceae bacterium]
MEPRDTRNNPIIIDATNNARDRVQPFDRVGGVIQSRSSSSLLSRVLVISSLGFFVSAIGVYIAPPYFAGPAFWLCVIATFGLIFAIRATRNNTLVSFSLFLLLALAMGFEISPWINQLLHTGHTNAVFNAALTTAVGMAIIGMAAQIFTFDYRRVQNYAFAGLIALVIAGVLGMFFHFINPTFYSYATLAIFSVLVVVDFMRIHKGGDGATPVELALSIYLDGINIFLALTQIFSGGRRD